MRALLMTGLAGFCVSAIVVDARAQCIPADTAGEIQEGRLVQKTIGGERVIILQIPTPVCLTGRGAQNNVRGTRAIQVYSSTSDVDTAIRRFVGKDVHVIGRALGATSPRHKASIVMDLSDIDQI